MLLCSLLMTELALDVLTALCSCAPLCGSTRRSRPTTPHTGVAVVTEEITTPVNKACTRSVSDASSVYGLHPATCLAAEVLAARACYATPHALAPTAGCEKMAPAFL